MSTSLGELFFRIGIGGASEVVAGLRQVAQAATDTASKGDVADKSLKNISSTMSGMVGDARMLATTISALGASFLAFSGVNLAAKYQAVTIGLTNILHSADGARKMMGELIKMGQETPFETSDLVGFSRELLATGSNAEQAVRQLRTLANVGANMGLPVGEVGEMTRMLGAMRSRGHAGVSTIQALQARGINMAEIIAATGGPKLSGPAAGLQAANILGSMTGFQAFDRIMTGLQKLNPQSAETFLSVMQNLGESIRNIMLPTGELLLPVLGSIGKAFQNTATAVGKLNEMTGGSAGLVVALGGAWIAGTRMVAMFREARTAVGELTASIIALATASREAALKNAGAAAAGSGAAGVIAPAAASGAAAAAVSSTGVRGLLGRALGWLKGAFSLKGLGIGMAVDWIGNMVGDKIGGGIGNVIKNAATFGGLGAAFGPWGAAGGAAIGIIKGLWENMHPAKSEDKLDKIAENTAKSADSLQSLQGRLLGGSGPRSNRAISEIEMDHALARALMLA